MKKITNMTMNDYKNYNNQKHIVYRYIDNTDGTIKYVGITKRKLSLRVEEHLKKDEWVKETDNWRIEYFYVNTKSDSEAWESHLIALYNTYEWFNSAKSNWGLIERFENIYPYWFVYSDHEEIVDINYDFYPILVDTRGLLSDIDFQFELDISRIVILKLIARRVIQPLAKTRTNNLLFIESDIEKASDYLKRQSVV